MSAIFTKGVETGRGVGAGKKDKLFHNNHRKQPIFLTPRAEPTPSQA